MRTVLRTFALVVVLLGVVICTSLVNPFEPDEQVLYYGEQVSMKWLMAFKIPHCMTTIEPRTGNLTEQTICFDTQEEVLQEIERRNATENEANAPFAPE